MIKKSVFEDEIISNMQKELTKTAQSEAIDNLDQAVDDVNSAIVLFEDLGMITQADELLKVLVKIAKKKINKSAQEDLSYQFASFDKELNDAWLNAHDSYKRILNNPEYIDHSGKLNNFAQKACDWIKNKSENINKLLYKWQSQKSNFSNKDPKTILNEFKNLLNIETKSIERFRNEWNLVKSAKKKDDLKSDKMLQMLLKEKNAFDFLDGPGINELVEEDLENGASCHDVPSYEQDTDLLAADFSEFDFEDEM